MSLQEEFRPSEPTEPGAPLTDVTSGFGREVTFWTVAAIVLRRRRLFVVVALSITAVGVAMVFLLGSKRTYTSGASLSLQSGDRQLPGLAGMAAQYGFSLPGSEDSNSPNFYADLLRSRRLLGPVVTTRYTVTTGSRPATATLVELLVDGEANADKALEKAIEELRSNVTTMVDRVTGVVSFRVRAPQAELARQIADRMLAGIHDYNLSTRRTQAVAEREFIEHRLSERRRELQEAESRLEAFLRQNRQFDNSPDLRFAHDRLNRDVLFRQQIVTTLTQSFEQARIEEVRNTPVFTVIEEPVTPTAADPRGRIVRSIIVLFLAVVVGFICALVAGIIDNARDSNSPGYHEFISLLRDARNDLPRLMRGS